MDKLTMAQDYIIAEVRRVGVCSVDEDKIMDAWKIADAMQAEADKRNKAEGAQKRKEIREMLNASNTFVEREGQHFDDVQGCKVDWRVAPLWAKYWALHDGLAEWFSHKPVESTDGWGCETLDEDVENAPSFGFTGTHIMERPHGF